MSFRDIVARTTETFIDAIAHELPVNVIEQAFPDFIKSRDDLRTSQFIISNTPAQLGQDIVFSIAEGAREIAVPWLEDDGQRDIPSGTVWFVDLALRRNAARRHHVQPRRIRRKHRRGLGRRSRRILTRAVSDPDQDWKTL